MHLMLCWLSSSTLLVALTLVDLNAPKSYLYKLTVIAHGTLGHLLQSVIISSREKLIIRLVNFRLTSEHVQLKPRSMGEAY
jgi:hypothetical protein